eukprot:TRINITY_DN4119_c0_g2_i1.p1 TRINITY_DN4119_c0_g2~~TRINITY_DN4119_c0_g2_i1.p1  ORF type:complete len:255 (+),score=72.48 TRINITY_DN4119_c0_g2_i1:464-1228(+)
MGAEVIRANMKHLEELRHAFTGVYGVFSMQPTGKYEMEMARNVAVAASERKVHHFVHLSMMGAKKNAPSHIAVAKARVEDEISAQPHLKWTIVRAGRLMDDFAPGSIYSPDSDGIGGFVPSNTKMPMICLADMAQCVAATFEAGYAKTKNAKMNLYGEVASMKEISKQIKEAIGLKLAVKTPLKMRRGPLRSSEHKFLCRLEKGISGAADERPTNAAPAVRFQQFVKMSFPKGWKPPKQEAWFSALPCMKGDKE